MSMTDLGLLYRRSLLVIIFHFCFIFRNLNSIYYSQYLPKTELRQFHILLSRHGSYWCSCCYTSIGANGCVMYRELGAICIYAIVDSHRDFKGQPTMSARLLWMLWQTCNKDAFKVHTKWAPLICAWKSHHPNAKSSKIRSKSKYFMRKEKVEDATPSTVQKQKFLVVLSFQT